MSKDKKTKAKRMGVKALLAHGEDKLTMTTFGKGNRSKIEFTEGYHGRALETPKHFGKRGFEVRKIDENVDLYGDLEEGKTIEALLINPSEKVGEDYLKLKGTLEKRFFGREFPHDNIRIQLIYNILDIYKILGMNVADILYALGNMQDTELDIDMFGQSLNNPEKAKDVVQRMKPYMGFFGGIFRTQKKEDRKKDSNLSEEEKEEKKKKQEELLQKDLQHNMDVARCISALRHATAHNKPATAHDKQDEYPWFKSSDIYETKIFKAGMWSVIEADYKKKIQDVNKQFFSKNKVNLAILFDLLDVRDVKQKKRISDEFYRFTIRKDGKNLGMNLVKIREIIIDRYASGLRDKKHDPHRQKINVIADFLIFRALSQNQGIIDKTVSSLRLTKDEEEKDHVYQNAAELVWGMVSNCLTPYFNDPKNKYILKYKDAKTPGDFEDWITSKISEDDGEPFVKVLSFLCNFLEGKEINELLTAYIHKFECIQDFLNVISSLGENVQFQPRFALFNNASFAQNVAVQLRILASIGKMKPDLTEAKRPLYKAAIRMLCPPEKWEKYTSDEWLEKNMLLNSEDRKNDKKKKQVNPFRNFIAGNVIESRRFMYLVRYSKPKAVRAIMQNRSIVNYVLHRLPSEQIKTYSRVFPEDFSDTEAEIDFLVNKLSEFSFETFISNQQTILNNSKRGFSPNRRETAEEIERLKAITGLYLSVAYIAIKNIVKANARYYIAFAVFERDKELVKAKDARIQTTIPNTKFTNYFCLTQYYLDRDEEKKFPGDPRDKEAFFEHLRKTKRHFSKQWREWLNEKIADAKSSQATGLLLREARNDVEHLNVLRAIPDYIQDFRHGEKGETAMNSYFELYHYLMQRLMLKNTELDLSHWSGWIMRSGRPDRDLIQIAFVSLAYNLPRYRNLTKEHHFDDTVLQKIREKESLD